MLTRITNNMEGAGQAFKHTTGSRKQVFRGFALKTAGGLTRKDLKKNKWGRIVSLKKSKAGAKMKKHLKKGGFFGRVHLTRRK